MSITVNAIRSVALPLAGIRVVNCADESGRFCAGLLADLGAEVVRGEGVEAGADVALITGTPAGLAARGLDPAALVDRDPRLIAAAISPFGLGGPRAEWRSSDTVAQALGGMLHVNGHSGEPPLRAMGPQAFNAAGVQAAIGIVLALLARRRCGRGQVVDVSVHESVIGALEHVTGMFRERGSVAVRQGTLHWSGTFRVAACQDGPVLLSHLGDWTALVEWMNSDGAAQDLVEPRFADPEVRRAECAHLFDVLAEWVKPYGVEELVEQAQRRRLPFAPVWPLRRVVGHPQLRARGFFAVDENGEASIVGPLARAFAATPGPFAGRAPAPRPAPPDGGRVLDGVRVLDLTWVVAGPVATRVLAEHGAEVIKLERLDAPDGPDRRAGWFGHLNRGKRSLAVDLGQASGIALARRLARQCDVVIDNFSPRVMANWGLDAATLRAADPRLIAVSLSGFGAGGPMADAVSYGPTLQAQTGFTWHMRHPSGQPAGWGFSYSDTIGGYCAALATLAALYERDRNGVGRAIDLSQLELLASCIGPLLEAALRGEDVADGLGNRSGEAGPPDGVFRCRDGADGRDRWCAIVLTDETEWRRFVAALGAPAWAGDRRFATAAARRANAFALDDLIEAWTAEQTPEAVMECLQAAGVTAGLVADARDLAADPQLAARGYWARLPTGETIDGVVPRLSATPGSVTAGGPRLGEHTDEVLRDLLGMEQSAVDSLRANGIVR